MMNSFGLHAAGVLAPALSPRLQRAVRLLQLSSMDYAQQLRQAADANPFLELDDATGAEPAPAEPPDEAGWDAEPPPGPPRPEGGEGGVFDSLPASATLADHLESQLRLMRLSPRELALATAVARSLDDDGYLRTPLPEVGVAAGLSPLPDADELAIALRHVQALEPAGVGARDVAECLLLQLAVAPALAGGADAALARAIVARHLALLARRDVAGLARALQAAPAAVEAACAAIRRLDPHPGWRVGGAAVPYVTPDVIVRRQRDQWVASLNPAVLPRVQLNNTYAQLYARHREACGAGLGAQLQEARWMVRNVEQRFATILAVARAILARQQAFLTLGPLAMKPLALREIARVVGAHESTVSRVTHQKYMATPCGVFELKYFFSRGLATASGGACSPLAVRGLIRELIAAEPPDAPLSDVALARELAQQGLQVARRTVTKYRQQLRIEPAEKRQSALR